MKSFSLAIILFLTVVSITAQAADDYDDPDYTNCQPYQIQLFLGNEYAYYGNPNNKSEPSSIITWRTDDVCEGSHFRIEGDKKSKFAIDVKARTETVDIILESESSYRATIHVAEIPEIPKEEHFTGKIYHNRDISVIFTFKLPRKGGKFSDQAKFIVYGNLGLAPESTTTVDAITNLIDNRFDEFGGLIDLGNSFLHLDGRGGKDATEYFKQLDPVVKLLPSIVLPNEENSIDSQNIFNAFVKNPNYGISSNHYFSVNVGHMHIIYYDIDYFSQLDRANKNQMLTWIKNDLKVANNRRHEVPWVVAINHNSIYCSYDAEDGDSGVHCHKLYHEREFWDELHHLGGIDLHLSSEIPSYERSHGIYKNTIETHRQYHYNHSFSEPNSTIYIVEGSAGEAINKTKKKYVLEDYTLELSTVQGFGVLSNPDRNTLKYEHFESATGKIVDYVFITKYDHPSPMGSYYLIYIAIGVVAWYFYTNKGRIVEKVRQSSQKRAAEENKESKDIPLIERGKENDEELPNK